MKYERNREHFAISAGDSSGRQWETVGDKGRQGETRGDKAIEVAFLTIPATEFFAEDQYQVLQTHYLDLGYGLEPMDAAVHNDAHLLPETFRRQGETRGDKGT